MPFAVPAIDIPARTLLKFVVKLATTISRNIEISKINSRSRVLRTLKSALRKVGEGEGLLLN